MSITDWLLAAGVTAFLVVLLGGYARLVVLACIAGAQRLRQSRGRKRAAGSSIVSELSRPEVNPWAETGFGPMGHPKMWCGTCAGGDQRGSRTELSDEDDANDPWGAAPGSNLAT